MPALVIVDLSGCGLSESIPGALSPRSFSRFILSDNGLTGGLPANITAMFFDVSHNALSGPVWLAQLQSTSEMVVNLAQNNLSCPIHLAHLTTLRRLNLQSGGFAGCDFSDAAQVQLPESLATLDVSNAPRAHTCAFEICSRIHFHFLRSLMRILLSPPLCAPRPDL